MRKIIFLTIILCLFASAAHASSATDRLQSFLDQGLVILKNPAYATKDTDVLKQQRDELEKVIAGIFDFELLSHLTVGKQWSKFTPEEQTEFTKAFKQLLEASYLSSLRGGGRSTEKIEILAEKPLKEDRVEVQTMVHTTDQDVPINYRMIKQADWMVYDVIVEGVSLVKNYREQFKDLLMRKTPAEVIEAVKEQAKKKRQAELEDAGIEK